MNYTNIEGWFDFEDLYSDIVKNINNNSTIVEVGVAYGKSIAFLANEIKLAGKIISLYGIDIWPNNFNIFFRNMMSCGLNSYIKPIRAPSKIAALMFPDETIDFCMIDADHKYTSVISDFESWRQKIKPGGILAFHDVHLLTVRSALDKVVGVNNGEIWGKTWIYKV